MAQALLVDEVFAQLAGVPSRRGGILDIPFDEYVMDVESPGVAKLLRTYADLHARPTLRAVIADRRFRQWTEVSARTRLGVELRRELEIVAGVTEEEYILEEDLPREQPRAAKQREPTLREWAASAGVSARLSDPAAMLSRRTADTHLTRALRAGRGVTVADLLDEKPFDARCYLPAGSVPKLRALAEAYVREIGERALAARRETARLAALAHVPEGEGARAFLAALDEAVARFPARAKPSAGAISLAHVELEKAPLRVVVQVALLPDRSGSPRNRKSWLLLDDWRHFPLESRVGGPKPDASSADAARVVLQAVRDVLRDPDHACYAALVRYLDEPSWSRVLRSLDEAIARAPHHEHAAEIEWRVTSGKGVRVVPYVRDVRPAGHVELRASSAESMVRGQVEGLGARDEAVARALWTASPAYYPYGYGHDGRASSESEARDRAFRALSLLEGHDAVRGHGGVPLRVGSGRLGIALEREGAGWSFVFDIAGEPLDAPEVRAALDALGQLIHVDPARGLVLLARVGAKEATILTAIASEAATFPDESAAALAGTLTVLGNLLPIVLPDELAGEPVEADARPIVRLERDGVDALSLTWLVRPIAGGPTFIPGEGPVQVLQQVGGRRVFATRALAEERRRLEALWDVLPAALRDGMHQQQPRAQCRGVETMLLVVERLRAAAAAGDVTVEWPKTPLPRVIGSADWSKLQLRVTAGRDWFGMSGSVEIENVTITLADLLAARRRGDRYVAVGPDKLVAIEDDLRAHLGELDAIARSPKTGLEIPRAAVPALADLLASRDQVDAAPAFWTLLARVDAARASDPKLPRGFAKVLRSYQVDGFRWMSRLAAWGAGACLADEMGLGKTVQALALLAARSKAGPALVVAPTSVGPNWMSEAKRFAPSLTATLYRGAGREAALARLGPGDLLVTSYDLLARDAESLAGIEFATVLLDEAQAIKNGGTTRARAARSLRADFRMALTGTPVENRLADLYSLMEFLNPGLFGTEDEFRKRYVVPIERDKDASRSADLARVVRPFLLRRRKTEVLSELPARTELTHAVERTPAERRLYEAARQLAIAALSGADEDARFRVLAEIMRLRRLACHPRLDDDTSAVPSSKLDAFLALVSELREAGHRALVFSQFTGHLALVQEALRARSVPYLYLDGKTPLVERTRRVAAFQAGEADVFLISLKAGGTGLNLTGADTVIHLDPWWNPAVEDQATDRAHRIGQTRPVTVIRLISQGTIEEAVMSLHADKRELAESILQGTSASGKLSIAELGALIREGVTA